MESTILLLPSFTQGRASEDVEEGNGNGVAGHLGDDLGVII